MRKTFLSSLLVVLVLILAAGCVQPSGFGPAATSSAPSSEATSTPADTLSPRATPTEIAPQAMGTLQGHVSIGPLRGGPVQEGDASATVPPEVYAVRPVLVYAEDGVTLLNEVKIDAQGDYKLALPAGRYVVSITLTGIDRSPQAPTPIDIRAGEIITLDISVDTGIR